MTITTRMYEIWFIDKHTAHKEKETANSMWARRWVGLKNEELHKAGLEGEYVVRVRVMHKARV